MVAVWHLLLSLKPLLLLEVVDEMIYYMLSINYLWRNTIVYTIYYNIDGLEISVNICQLWWSNRWQFHQTLHFFPPAGFIFDPTGQLKSAVNSSILENGPWTLNWGGECTPVVTNLSMACGLYFEHQTVAALIQKSCLGEYARPGNCCSGPCSVTQQV